MRDLLVGHTYKVRFHSTGHEAHVEYHGPLQRSEARFARTGIYVHCLWSERVSYGTVWYHTRQRDVTVLDPA